MIFARCDECCRHTVPCIGERRQPASRQVVTPPHARLISSGFTGLSLQSTKSVQVGNIMVFLSPDLPMMIFFLGVFPSPSPPFSSLLPLLISLPSLQIHYWRTLSVLVVFGSYVVCVYRCDAQECLAWHEAWLRGKRLPESREWALLMWRGEGRGARGRTPKRGDCWHPTKGEEGLAPYTRKILTRTVV